MAKLREKQVQDFQYGSNSDIDRTLQFCAENPNWPKYCEKEKVRQMNTASGMKIRRFVNNPDVSGDVDPQRIRSIFQNIWVPIALHEPDILMHSTKTEFESQAYQESELRLLVNQILDLISEAEEKKNRKVGEPEKNQEQQSSSQNSAGSSRAQARDDQYRNQQNSRSQDDGNDYLDD